MLVHQGFVDKDKFIGNGINSKKENPLKVSSFSKPFQCFYCDISQMVNIIIPIFSQKKRNTELRSVKTSMGVSSLHMLGADPLYFGTPIVLAVQSDEPWVWMLAYQVLDGAYMCGGNT
jgi:hypothetical protein